MLHVLFKRGDWFAPKRFGYGAGWPIAWQGWLVMALYVGAVAGALALARNGHSGGHAAGAALIALVTGLFALITAKRTRGGWKWRWGERD